jgi:hypothetical protein
VIAGGTAFADTAAVRKKSGTANFAIASVNAFHSCPFSQVRDNERLVEQAQPMSRHEKMMERILGGSADKNISFGDLRSFLKGLEFVERINGDHYIFSKEGVEEILNLQPKGSKAKPYQVKQVRNLILKYQMGSSADD